MSINMSNTKSMWILIDCCVDRNVGAKLGAGINGRVDSYFGAEVGSGDDEGVRIVSFI